MHCNLFLDTHYNNTTYVLVRPIRLHTWISIPCSRPCLRARRIAEAANPWLPAEPARCSYYAVTQSPIVPFGSFLRFRLYVVALQFPASSGSPTGPGVSTIILLRWSRRRRGKRFVRWISRTGADTCGAVCYFGQSAGARLKQITVYWAWLVAVKFS